MSNLQSISIQSHKKVQVPSPHIAYTISLTTPVKSWTVDRRYSDFESLDKELKSETGLNSLDGVVLPPKRGVGSWFLPSGHGLNDEKALLERQQALETYLRHILSHKSPAYRSSHAFADFLALPTPASITSVPASSSWTPSSWMVEANALVSTSSDIRATLQRRDQLITSSQPSSEVAKESVRVRRELGAFEKRVASLQDANEGFKNTKGLLSIGEVRRRDEIVERLKGDVKLLRSLQDQRPTSTVSLPGSFGASPSQSHLTSNSSRSALLGSAAIPPTTRVFGKHQPVETDETRPLGESGLMQLQQTKMDDQDTQLRLLSGALRRQRDIGQLIGQEIEEQNELLDKLTSDVDTTGAKLGRAKRQMNRLK